MYPVLAFSGHISVFCREHPLKNPLFFEGCELKQVKAEGREQHFGMHPENGCDPGMSRMEHILDDGIWAFPGRSDSRDSSVSENIVDTDRMPTNTPLHGGVETFCFGTEISSVTVDHLSFVRQVDLRIVG